MPPSDKPHRPISRGHRKGFRFSPRRGVQVASLVVLNSRFLAVTTGKFCLPVMNCEACPLAWLLCPVGLAREALVFHTVPWALIGWLALFGLLAGRMFCGWVCPAGLIQDALHRIPSRKFELPRWTRGIKYGVLLFGVVLTAWFLGKNTLWFYCNYCPVSALQVAFPSMIAWRDWSFDAGRWVRFGALALVLGLSISQSRAFCKLFCPVGAAMALPQRLARLRLRLHPDRCVSCTRCNRTCSMQVPVMTTPGNVLHQAECIGCLTCRNACPTHALHLNFQKTRPGAMKSPTPDEISK